MSDEHLGYPGAPPGWYPDPAGGTAQRWWDGYKWSEAVVAPAPTTPPESPPWAVASVRMASATANDLVRVEVSMTPVARVALAYPGIASLVLLLFVRVNAAQMRFVGHQIHLADLAARNNQPAPTLQIPTLNAATNALLSVNWFVLLGAIIVSLIWQHRAASAARALGLPTRHSPAWGVGAWFVPVVNFFIPYQALTDCLKAGDAGRGLILRYWLLGGRIRSRHRRRHRGLDRQFDVVARAFHPDRPVEPRCGGHRAKGGHGDRHVAQFPARRR